MTATGSSKGKARQGLVLWSIVLALGLLLPWVADRCPDAVEAAYSKGLFPPIAVALGFLGGLVRFSVAQIIVGVALIGLIF
ncbi:MAG: hypothetical protein KC729_08425, partial [Candidatus Eisenbacteria bacterium]|nr:hypothetical protein [Candidatus Eisenbacteria bacterium]